MGILFLVIILLLDFPLSIWNAYASGYNIALIKKSNQKGFAKIAAYSGLGLAFVGTAYVVIMALSIIAYSIGYISFSPLEALLALDFLVFGLLIIGFGLMVTIESIIIASKRRSIWDILVAVWNTGAEIFDVASYISGFRESVQMLRGGLKGERDEGSILIILVVALLIAFFITHAAYRHGLAKGSNQ